MCAIVFTGLGAQQLTTVHLSKNFVNDRFSLSALMFFFFFLALILCVKGGRAFGKGEIQGGIRGPVCTVTSAVGAQLGSLLVIQVFYLVENCL